MSAYVLLNSLNELGNREKNARFAEHFISFFATSFINSIKQSHEC